MTTTAHTGPAAALSASSSRVEAQINGTGETIPGGRSSGRDFSTAGTAELVLERVRLRARRRVAWLRELWSQEGAPGGAETVTHAEIDAYLDDKDAPLAEAAWIDAAPHLRRVNEQLVAVEAELSGRSDSSLSRLADSFQLNYREADVLQACWALSLDRSLARVFAYMHDHAGRTFVTDSLVGRLFGHGRGPVISAGSPLVHWELISEQPIEPGAEAALTVETTVRDWLGGSYAADPLLPTLDGPLPANEMIPSWPVDAALAAIRKARNRIPSQAVRVKVTGQPASGRRTFAAYLGGALGIHAILLNGDQVVDSDWPRIYMRATRHALLTDSALVWYGESCFRRSWPTHVRPYGLQFVVAEPGQSLARIPGLLDVAVELPELSVAERLRLWMRVVPAASSWQPDEVRDLAAGNRAVVGEIAVAGLHDPESPTQASTLARSASRERVGSLAQRMETPFRIDDLVVSAHLREAIEDFIYEARSRIEFWEQPEATRLFPQGRGLLALLSGPPGTGKTMAAQVVAAALGLDLYRVDLSAVVSKYVGETSQNLERVLSRTAHMDVVLLFDEADALFGRRTEIRDAHDRFANTDTNYLLQAIEAYQGVGLLATNKKGNIDPAFIRRLRYVMEFQKPDAAQRLVIWRQIVRGLAGAPREKALIGDLQLLAREVDATGAQIKFSVLTAVFAARRAGGPLSRVHLVGGLDRELAKSGRSLSDRERARLLGDA